MLKKKVLNCANILLDQWQKNIAEQINYTGLWNDHSIYTGISGYALLYLELGILQDNRDYTEQAFFLAEKCCMHLHDQQLSFLIGNGGPLAVAAAAAHALKQPEKEEHFIHRYDIGLNFARHNFKSLKITGWRKCTVRRACWMPRKSYRMSCCTGEPVASIRCSTSETEEEL